MREFGINMSGRGLRVFNASRNDKPNIGVYGTIYVPPYDSKTDTLRTCAGVWILVCESLCR